MQVATSNLQPASRILHLLTFILNAHWRLPKSNLNSPPTNTKAWGILV